jgi:hypothetical protein
VNVRVANVDGQAKADVFSAPSGTGAIFHPHWTWDATGIVFTYASDVWKVGVSVVDGEAVGDGGTMLADESWGGGWGAYSPAASPVDDEVAYRDGAGGVSVVPYEGGAPTQLYMPAATPQYPDYDSGHLVWGVTWTADGASILFVEEDFSTGLEVLKVLDRASGTVVATLLESESYVGIHGPEGARTSDDIYYTADGIFYRLEMPSETPVALFAGGRASISGDDTAAVYMSGGKLFRRIISTGAETQIESKGNPNWPDERR